SDGVTVRFAVVTSDRGDVRELKDESGAAFAHYAYDAYGRPLATDSRATSLVTADVAARVAEANVLRYAGCCYDEPSGLYYLSQRYYDPQTMCFLSKDPARADGEQSAYQYCGGDPVGKLDPSGEDGSAIVYGRWSSLLVCGYGSTPVPTGVGWTILKQPFAYRLKWRAWAHFMAYDGWLSVHVGVDYKRGHPWLDPFAVAAPRAQFQLKNVYLSSPVAYPIASRTVRTFKWRGSDVSFGVRKYTKGWVSSVIVHARLEAWPGAKLTGFDRDALVLKNPLRRSGCRQITRRTVM
ncbi:MAG: RHS repeat-associated core domain-containing protein, partial [Anaerosomatales bacterium]|nr:RHS repeat-associated core domain-containing protein [Anaerosomatales bacterium]